MTLSKRFRVLNENFTCEACHGEIFSTTGGTPRNHCPFCLCSKHVDINPGDRANSCRGLMHPVGVTQEGSREWVIHHRCERCGVQSVVRAILKDKRQVDDFELMIALSQESCS